MNWLNNISLQSDGTKLVPLSKEHTNDLVKATQDGDLWKLWYTSVPKPEQVSNYIANAIKERTNGHSFAFAVIDIATNKAIGSTRFCNLDQKNKRLEIGYTWYAKSFQRCSVNTEAKLALLEHAFEQLGCIAVEFRTNWHNQTSRSAIARLGAKQDGVLRQHQIMADGSYRDTVVFSILNSEWLAVKKGLILKLALYKQ